MLENLFSTTVGRFEPFVCSISLGGSGYYLYIFSRCGGSPGWYLLNLATLILPAWIPDSSRIWLSCASISSDPISDWRSGQLLFLRNEIYPLLLLSLLIRFSPRDACVNKSSYDWTFWDSWSFYAEFWSRSVKAVYDWFVVLRVPIV